MAEPTEIQFPLGGMDVSGEFGVQRPGTTPLGINVHANDPILERNRGGSRHGLAKYADQLPSGSEVVQYLGQLVVLDPDYLLATFQDFQTDFVDDPSTNNNSSRNPPGRKVPPKGSGVDLNRNRPSNPRRQVALTSSTPTATDGDTVTLTATLTRQNADTVVAGQKIVLITQPSGHDGEGDTATTDVSGQVTFTVSEATFEGSIRYIAYHVYTPPV